MTRTLDPILEIVAGCKLIFITSTPRHAHWTLGCCTEDSHMTNRGSGLLQEVSKELDRTKEKVRRALDKRNMRMNDPTRFLG